MPDQKRKEFKQLIDKYLSGTASPEEQELLDGYYRLFRDEPETTKLPDTVQLAELEARMEAKLFERIQPARTKRLWPRIAAAASILLFLAAGTYFIVHKNEPKQSIAQNQINDIKPGRNQATLTLAGGKKIIISKDLKGQIAVQGYSTITANGAITYKTLNISDEVTYNTLTTARGEQSPYTLVLADGTKAWLNAASSITFPVAFNGKDRKVTITGEVYFEVVHNAKQPFLVQAKGQTIEDIGTAFNVNAYDDEPNIRTTLVSGSVKINNTTTLKPGQVAIQKGEGLTVRNVDTEGATAWKNGYFLFDHEDLPGIMRKISRWYDVDVEYPQGQNISAGFFGSITRYSKVSQVLNMLETTGNVKFKIEGRKIIVTKK